MLHKDTYLELGKWQALEGGYGAHIAIDADLTAVASPHQLILWDGTNLRHEYSSDLPIYGFPRITSDQIFWGARILNMADHTHSKLTGIMEAVVDGTGAAVIPGPRGHYQPGCYAWSKDGRALVVAASWVHGPPQYPSRAVLLNDRGQLTGVLWEAQDIGITAAWVGEKWIALGTRQVTIYDRGGILLEQLDESVPAQRIEASADESRLLVVEAGRICLVDAKSWHTIGIWEGLWLDAAIDTDGRFVVALDLEGALHVLYLDATGTPHDNTLRNAQAMEAIALGGDRITVAFEDDMSIQTCNYTIRS
jgi:hypothetical protein